jgi:hypothetical protein
MRIPESSIITREEADKRRRESKHHVIAEEGDYALHTVHDPKTGVTTVVGEAVKVDGKWKTPSR